MAVNLPGLAQILEASLDPTQNKQGSILILIPHLLYQQADLRL